MAAGALDFIRREESRGRGAKSFIFDFASFPPSRAVAARHQALHLAEQPGRSIRSIDSLRSNGSKSKATTLQNPRAKSKPGRICCILLELKVAISEPIFPFETVWR